MENQRKEIKLTQQQSLDDNYHRLEQVNNQLVDWMEEFRRFPIWTINWCVRFGKSDLLNIVNDEYCISDWLDKHDGFNGSSIVNKICEIFGKL